MSLFSAPRSAIRLASRTQGAYLTQINDQRVDSRKGPLRLRTKEAELIVRRDLSLICRACSSPPSPMHLDVQFSDGFKQRVVLNLHQKPQPTAVAIAPVTGRKIIVDPQGGGDVRTLTEAIDRSDTDTTILLRSGHYKETCRLRAAQTGLTIQADTDARPVIVGSRPIENWQSCSSKDAPWLGKRWRHCKFAKISKSELPMLKHTGIQVFSQHRPVPLAHLSKLRFDISQRDPDSFLRSENVTVDADQIHFEHRRLHGQPDLGLTNAWVFAHVRPNLVRHLDIGSFSGTKLSCKRADFEPMAPARFAVMNCLGGIEQGQWGFRDAGDAVVIYVWPETEAQSFEIGIHEWGIEFDGADRVTIRGVEFANFASQRGQAAPIRTAAFPNRASEGLLIEHCRFRAIFNAQRGHGLRLVYQRNVTLKDCEFSDYVNSAALSLHRSHGARLERLRFKRISGAGLSLYGAQKAQINALQLSQLAFDAHANAIEIYGSKALGHSNTVLIARVTTRETKGYATFQNTTDLAFLYCDFEASLRARDGRALVDQSKSPHQVQIAVINCRLRAGHRAKALFLNSGKPWVINTIAHGAKLSPTAHIAQSVATAPYADGSSGLTVIDGANLVAIHRQAAEIPQDLQNWLTKAFPDIDLMHDLAGQAPTALRGIGPFHVPENGWDL